MAAAVQERVLLVDDEPDLQQLLSFNLREAGYMTPAEHGKAERGSLAYGAFGVILVVVGILIDNAFG